MHLTTEARTMLLVALEVYIKTLESDYLIDKFRDLEDELVEYDPADDIERLHEAQINAWIAASLSDQCLEEDTLPDFGHAMRADPEDQLDLEDAIEKVDRFGYPTERPSDTEPPFRMEARYPIKDEQTAKPVKQKKGT
jgi:hypothetical protein